MSKRKFAPIPQGNLNKFTDEERQAYIASACDYLGIPPEFGLVDLIWMDSGDGAKNLTLYVKRGGTDIIRERLKISVIDLAEANGDGYVGWKAKGRDANGREEMAVGTVSIKNLGGPAVANAVKISQTQALRRMTLQFVGGGFLDESELNEKTTSLASSIQPLSQIAQQPMVAPNIAAGKDITQVEETTIRPEVMVVAQESIDNNRELLQSLASEEPVKRKRRRRGEVSLDSPEPSHFEDLQQSLGDALAFERGQAIDLRVTEIKKDTAKSAVVEPTLVKEYVDNKQPDVKLFIDKSSTIVTKEQEGQFRDKLSNYVNEILPKGGFLQSENLSRIAKMGKFVKKMYPDTNMKTLTLEQWTRLFDFLDTAIKEKGVEALVKEIESQIKETQ